MLNRNMLIPNVVGQSGTASADPVRRHRAADVQQRQREDGRTQGHPVRTPAEADGRSDQDRVARRSERSSFILASRFHENRPARGGEQSIVRCTRQANSSRHDRVERPGRSRPRPGLRQIIFLIARNAVLVGGVIDRRDPLEVVVRRR